MDDADPDIPGGHRSREPDRPPVDAAAAAPSAVLALLPGIAWMSDAVDWRPRWVSDSLRPVAGYEPAEWVRVREFWEDRVHPDDRPAIIGVVAEATERGESPPYDYRWRVADGSYHWFRDRLWVVPGPGGGDALVGFMVDVTAEYEERAGRVAAERQRDQLEAAIEQSTDIVTITDAAGVVRYANPAIERILGVPPSAFVGQGIFHFADLGTVDTGERDAALRNIATTVLAGDRWEGEYEVRTQAGKVFQIESTVTPVRDETGRITMTLGIHRDVTHVRGLETRLAEAARVEAIGQLASGVAHDFNNILTAILGYTSLIAERQAADSPIREDLEQVRAAGERAQRLTQQLLAFGRRSVLRPSRVDVGAVVGGLAPMLQRLIGEAFELRLEGPDDHPTAFVDRDQLELAVMNLVVNARNAMPGGGPIDLGVATRAGDGEGTPAGSWAVVTVRDRGVGMSPAVVSRIFEPFYTTQASGRGTGLGLTVVEGFVKLSGGRVLVSTAPGRGSTFELWLPTAPAPIVPAGAQAEAPAPSPVPMPVRSSLTVLVAEDDALVRQIARRALAQAGHRVLLASSGEEAVEVAARLDGPIDVLLADVVMPGMRGPQLAQAIRAVRPGLRVVLTSGYTEEAVDQPGVPPDVDGFLAKPYTIEELVAAVEARGPTAG